MEACVIQLIVCLIDMTTNAVNRFTFHEPVLPVVVPSPREQLYMMVVPSLVQLEHLYMMVVPSLVQLYRMVVPSPVLS